MTTMKRCRRESCKQNNPQSTENFFNDKHSADGKGYWCKGCWKEYRGSDRGKAVQAKWRRSEKNKASQKRYNQSTKGKSKRKCRKKKYRQTERGKAQHRAENKRYRDRHPERERARSEVTKAVDRSEIPSAKELECLYCNQQAEEYHHYLGYAKEHWLDVISLCNKCHNLTHDQ